MSAIAIIPARGGSKRLPRKNIADIGGRPLLSYPVETALESGVFEHVIVSSEDDEILTIADKYGAHALKRPAALATDTVHELEACADILQREAFKDYTFFCVIYPAALFITGDDLNKSYAQLQENNQASGVMCVSPFNYHPYKALRSGDEGFLEMMFPDQAVRRSQHYPHLTASNGTFYWLRSDVFLNNSDKGYYQDHMLGYEIPATRAVDIDTPADLEEARLLMTMMKDKKHDF